MPASRASQYQITQWSGCSGEKGLINYRTEVVCPLKWNHRLQWAPIPEWFRSALLFCEVAAISSEYARFILRVRCARFNTNAKLLLLLYHRGTVISNVFCFKHNQVISMLRKRRQLCFFCFFLSAVARLFFITSHLHVYCRHPQSLVSPHTTWVIALRLQWCKSSSFKRFFLNK